MKKCSTLIRFQKKIRNLLLCSFAMIGLFFLGLNANAQGINSMGYITKTAGYNLSGYHIVYAKLRPTNGDGSGKIDGVFTLSADSIVAWTDYSIAVRTSNWGTKAPNFDVRNGGSMTADQTVPFEFDKNYHIWIETAVFDKKYSVYLLAEGMTEPIKIASEYSYRKTDIAELKVWTSLYNPAENKNELVIENFSIVDAVGKIPGGSAVSQLATLNKAELFPNPTNDAFQLKVDGDFEYTVINLAGAVVANGKANRSCVFGSELNKGVYLLKVTQNGKAQTLRIIKS
jgi:hypothetical protein